MAVEHSLLEVLVSADCDGWSALNTCGSAESGARAGAGGPQLGADTSLTLSLPLVSRASQWSEVDETVEPAERR